MKRFIGLDVHKSVIEACVIDEEGKRLFRRRIDCTRDALLRFAEELTKEDSFALEVTTNAWAVADFLQPFVGRLVVSKPMKTKAIAEAKVKTDKVDAEVLAQLLRCDYLPNVWVPDQETRSLRHPATTQQKLARLRVSVTGELRKPEHKGRRPGVKNGGNPPTRLTPSLVQVCRQEGLHPVHGFEELPAGEQRILQSLGVIDYVAQISQERRTPRTVQPRKREKICEP